MKLSKKDNIFLCLIVLCMIIGINIKISLNDHGLRETALTKFYFDQANHEYAYPGKKVFKQIYRVNEVIHEFKPDTGMYTTERKVISKKRYRIRYLKIQ